VLPPLRERPEDFAPLVAHFAGQVARKTAGRKKLSRWRRLRNCKNILGPGTSASCAISSNGWCCLAEGDTVGREDVQLTLPAGAGSGDGTTRSSSISATGTLAERTEGFEKEVLLAEIRRNNFHMTTSRAPLASSAAISTKNASNLALTCSLFASPNSPDLNCWNLEMMKRHRVNLYHDEDHANRRRK